MAPILQILHISKYHKFPNLTTLSYVGNERLLSVDPARSGSLSKSRSSPKI